MCKDKISFYCTSPDKVIFSDDRKHALSMIRTGKLKGYKNIVVRLPNGERFNLDSIRGREYFGLKK